jgi:hypothetical protein
VNWSELLYGLPGGDSLALPAAQARCAAPCSDAAATVSKVQSQRTAPTSGPGAGGHGLYSLIASVLNAFLVIRTHVGVNRK